MRNRVALAVFCAVLSGAGSLFGQRAEDWPDPIGNHVIPCQTAGITVGPMIGQPDATSARVWLRTDAPADFEVVYDTSLPLDEESSKVAGRTVSENDNTGVVDLRGLKPNTRRARQACHPSGDGSITRGAR